MKFKNIKKKVNKSYNTLGYEWIRGWVYNTQGFNFVFLKSIDGNEVHIYEVKTGLRVCVYFCKSKEPAIDKLNQFIDRHGVERIKEEIERHEVLNDD